MSLIERYKEFPDHIWLRLYRRRLPRLVTAMRQKEKIRVLFVLHCLDKWKTEGLYRLMLSHPRFEPILGVALGLQDYPGEALKKYQRLTDYLAQQGYAWRELCQKGDLDDLAPDIIFYIEPYNGVINRGLEFRNAPNALFCYTVYGIHTVAFPWSYSSIFFRMLWQEYYESPLAASQALRRCPSRRRNIVYTGTTFADQLMAPATADPWKAQDKPKKRIIYAPHYSITDPHDDGQLFIGTFLQHGERMLALAEKYADQTQWAFKPHPCLFRELAKVWGEARAKTYYDRWATLANGQYAEGQYLDLFKHSDAMIHDSCSFICEYLFMHRPVLFLDNGHTFEQNALGHGGLEQHYHAHTAEDIEQFIHNVLTGNDPMREARDAYVATHLAPPHNRLAAENILAAILGNK